MAREEPREDKWVRVRAEDKLFLETESLRLMRERFRETRELARVSMADTVASLLEELRELRSRSDDEPSD